jgi:hypothetical protein
MGNLTSEFTGLLGRLRERGFANVAGADVTVQLPLRETFVNEIIAAGIADKGAPVRYVRLAFRGGSRVGIEVEPKLFLVPRLRIEADIQDVVDCAQDPTLRLRLTSDSFSTALILQGANLFKLPEGMNFAGNQLTLHLPTLLERQNLGDLAPLLRYVLVTGQPGVLFVRLNFAVPLAAGDTGA